MIKFGFKIWFEIFKNGYEVGRMGRMKSGIWEVLGDGFD